MTKPRTGTKRKATAAAERLTDAIQQASPPRKNTFIDRLPDDQRDQLGDIKALYHDGQLPGWSAMDIYHWLIERGVPIDVGKSRFRRWLHNNE